MERGNFQKLSSNKAINTIIKTIKSNLAFQNIILSDESAFYIEGIPRMNNVSREIIKLCEFIVASADMEEDIDKIRKNISSKLKSIDINYFDLYYAKFKLSEVLLTISITTTALQVEERVVLQMSLLHRALCILEILKCKTDKHEIIGIDVANNRVRYKSRIETWFDVINSKFVSKELKDAYNRVFEVIEARLKMVEDLPVGELVARVNDKTDELLNSYYLTGIMLNALNIEDTPSLESRVYCSSQISCAKIPLKDLNEKRIVCEHPTVIETSDNKKIKIVDVTMRGDPYFVMTFVDSNGNTDTHIVSSKEEQAIYTCELDILEDVVNFYSGDFRNITLEDEAYFKHTGSKREYKRQVVPIYMHTAKMGNPSKEAKELAKKWGIKLKPGETLVKSHLRHYGEKNKNK